MIYTVKVRTDGSWDDEGVRLALDCIDGIQVLSIDATPPQLAYDKLEGESEAEFSVRMAKVQGELGEERRELADQHVADPPEVKASRVWGS